MPLSKFWMSPVNKKRKKIFKKNIKVDDETIKQIKNLIKIYGIMKQTLGYETSEYMDLKDTLKILKQNKKVTKDKEDTKTEFDIWFNSRK